MQTRAQGGYVDQRKKGNSRQTMQGYYASLGAPRTDKSYHPFRIAPRMPDYSIYYSCSDHAQTPSLAPFVTCVTVRD